MAFHCRGIVWTLALATLAAAPATAQTLRVAPHSDLKVVDPVWTTALISVNHGYILRSPSIAFWNIEVK